MKNDLRNPNFENLRKILRGERPERPTLFEFFLNPSLYEHLAGFPTITGKDPNDDYKLLIHAFKAAGYDYATVRGSDFSFPQEEIEEKHSKSLNDGALISDWESFNQYAWPNPDSFDYSGLKNCEEYLPDGMKVIVWGPGGVLENVISLVGYENLCYMLIDDEELVEAIFEAVGSRFVRYYEICAAYDAVGALISNDDWGFNTQTMIAPEQLRKYVFPWHKRIVEVIHKQGKPAILHSCGNLDNVMDDIIEDIKYDGKHSYEDNTTPVEAAYEKLQGRIAVLGGIDVDFVCRATPNEIYTRASAMLERAKERGGYALGTGNSIPDYVPWKNYFAMISAATGIDLGKDL